MKHLWPWLLAALGGALMALGFPPFEQDGLVWFALTPLIAALWFSPRTSRFRPLRLFGLGYLAGLVFFWTSLFWVTEVTRLGWFIFAFYLALYPAVWALFAGIVCRPRDPVPGRPLSDCEWLKSFHNLRLAFRGAAAWAGLEWLRGTLFTGFGWNSLGVAMWKNTALIQIADLTGVAGISFLIVLVNLIVVISIRRIMLEAGRVKLRPHFDFTITVALVCGAFIYGILRVNQPLPIDPATKKREEAWLLSIAAVQANIPQDHKWDPAFEDLILKTYLRLTDNAIAFKPDLLIWPEASTPRPMLDNEDLRNEVIKILGKLKTNFLLGTIRYVPPDFAYNSAILLNARGEMQIYDKQHLVPFGEYVPLRHSFPLFAWIVGDEVSGDFNFGAEPTVMQLSGKPFRIAPLICFEDTVGDLTRRFAQRGAELMITLTNDGWFRHSAESRQHLANAVLRSAETKLPLVRCANTGVTCFIDRFGHVTRTLDTNGNTFIEGLLYGTVPIRLEPPKTFYTNYGDLFAIVCFFGALLSIRIHLLTSRRPGLSEN
jgi:apolipoprotein N-acyltransferase